MMSSVQSNLNGKSNKSFQSREGTGRSEGCTVTRMENSTLTLNEEALQTMPETKRPVFIYSWLRRLERNLNTVNRQDVKEAQKTLVAQLMAEVTGGSPGPPTRQLVAQCMATLFSVGDTFLLFDTINKCNDILKVKDDSPAVLPSRLAATVVVGTMYQVRASPACQCVYCHNAETREDDGQILRGDGLRPHQEPQVSREHGQGRDDDNAG